MYSNLTLFKQYLWWIEWNDQDALLTGFLNAANEQLNSLCWVDSFDLKSYEQMIDARAIVQTSRGLEVYLKNKPVKIIEEINWDSEAAGTKWTDYLVIYDRRVIFRKLSLNSFWFVNIKYKAWYDRARVDWNTTVDDLPDDLKMMEMMIASWMYQKKWYEWVQTYKLGDESITFWDVNGTSSDDIYFSFKNLLNKYQNFNLPV